MMLYLSSAPLIIKYTVSCNEFPNKMEMFLIVPLRCKSLENTYY